MSPVAVRMRGEEKPAGAGPDSAGVETASSGDRGGILGAPGLSKGSRAAAQEEAGSPGGIGAAARSSLEEKLPRHHGHLSFINGCFGSSA